MRIKFSKLNFSEIGLILLVGLVSVVVSSQVAIFNREINSFFEGITAHTLVSLRDFEEWGFWKLLGASTLFPKSYEYNAIDVTTLTKPEVYLSYPSLWLVLPYIAFKLLNILSLNASISPEYLRLYNLTFNRILCGFIVYYLYLEIIKILSQNVLTAYQKRLVALLGLIGWVFSPPVLHWTQNVYFTDEAVLLPIYTIFLIALKCRLNFEQLPTLSKFLLVISSILACGFDWYGWISVAIIIILKFVHDLSENKNSFFSKPSLQQYLKSINFLIIGVILSGFTYIIQLAYYKEGFKQILGTFFLRAIATSKEIGVSVTPLNMLRGIVMHWCPYFPDMIQPLLVRLVYTESVLSSAGNQVLILDPVLFKTIDESKQFSFINAFVIFVVIFTLFLFSLYYIFKQSRYKAFVLYVYTLLFLAPLIQLFLLKQHSFIHSFSAFKMSLPITFSLLVLPILTLSYCQKNLLSNSIFNISSTNTMLSVFVTVLGVIIVTNSVGEVKEFAAIVDRPDVAQEIGFLLSKNVASMELPITDVPNLVVGAYPPNPIWYGNRYIYDYQQVKGLHLRANSHNLKSMNPVFLTYKDTLLNSSVSSICQGKWIDLTEKVESREIVACKDAELRRLVDGA